MNTTLDRRLRILAWVNLLVCLGLFGVAAGLYVTNQPAPEWRQIYDLEIWTLMAWSLLFPLVALLILVNQPRSTIGWLMSAIGIVTAVNIFSTQFAIFGLYTRPMSGLLPPVALWLRTWIWVPAITLLAFLLLLFPTGELPSPRWRVVALLLILSSAGSIALSFSELASLPTTFEPSPRPSFINQAANLLLALFLMAFAASVLSLLYRWHGATVVARQQIKWVAWAGLVLGLVFFLGDFIIEWLWQESSARTIASRASVTLAVAGLAASILIAILRYRLFDIDVIIRKTTSYAILTSLLILIYFGSGVLFQRLLTPFTSESDVAVVLSTLLVAALFLPLRYRIQDVIDRRFFRRKYDAEQVLARFAATAREETNLDALTAELLRVIQETMEPEHVGLWLRKTPDDRSQTT